jgi:hypothetical protein
MNEKITPQNIEDIVDNINVYLEKIRKMNNDDKIKTINRLEQFVKQYFKNTNIDRSKLIQTSSYLIDTLYKNIINLPGFDINTNGYFGIIINRIFFELSQKGVYIFYIIDNSLRDDKFVLLKILFKNAGFDMITPNNIAMENTFKNFYDTSPEFTNGQNLDYKTIENQIVESIKNKRHIVYIEKDNSVNYLSNVIKLADEFQNKYVCIFRNTSIEDLSPAKVLIGSFGNILDN